jgi:thioredoxin reductase/NAD-dependent dihydropyrimidine dehydrogenase PreA subunit
LTDDPALVWLLAGLASAGLVLPYLVLFRRRRASDLTRKREARELGIDRPVAQYPHVEAARCIGCGACVDACPEGDVLGLVGGTATIVNGLKCVGHGTCADACPVGAIQVGLGDLGSRPDIPWMDDWHETNVPGLFVAGELGGLALVKNAVAQGRRVIERIAQRTPPLRGVGGREGLDVVIVGAGPAGLAAAAAARERGLSHVVLEKERSLGGTIFHYPRRKLVLVQSMDIPLAGMVRAAEYSKEQVLALFEDLARRFRLDVRFGEPALDVQRQGRLLVVKSERGLHAGRAVVLALGRRGTPRKLGVPGEQLPKVMYQLVDAESYEEQRVLIVGGGDSAVEAALGLARQPGNRVTLSYRRPKLVRIKRKNEERIAAAIRQGRVRPAFGSEVVAIGERSVRLRTARGEQELDNDYVFVFAGGEPPFGLLRRIGVRFGEEAAAGAAGG